MNIRNMEITEGVHNWDGSEGSLTAGSISIRLPNGTVIQICSVLCNETDYSNATIKIHRIKDTEITLFEKSSTITKRSEHGEFTRIKKKVA
mgnify:CR=1 FL=1